MEMLHLGAKWLFRFRAYSSLVIFIFILAWLTPTILMPLLKGNLFLILIISALIVIVLTIIFGEIYARMAYKRWLYELTKDSLKLERGIIWKRYSNVPYSRVQNIDIRRGILARMLGFSTLDIQTAGYAASYGRRGMPRSEGHIPAVSIEKAEKIREFLIKKIGSRGSSSGM